MPKYLLYGSYTPKGLERLLAEGGSKHAESARQVVERAGGTIEAAYFSFGKNDFYIIADLPDDSSATAISLAANAGAEYNINTAVLITPEQVDEAVRKSLALREPRD